MARIKLPGLSIARLASWRPQLKTAVPAVLIAIGLAFIVAVVWIWSWPLSTADRFAAIGDAATICGLVLAAFAAIVALAAYLVATQSPDLEAEIEFLSAGDRNKPVFLVGQADERMGTRLVVIPTEHDPALIRIRNRSSFAAHTPAIRIDLVGLGGLKAQPGWTIGWVQRDPFNQQWAQWEGGADYAIHGHWLRALPELSFEGVAVYPGVDVPIIVITLVADAMAPKWQTIPIDVKDDATYPAYVEERRARNAREPGRCEIGGCADEARFVIVVRVPGHAVQTLHVCAKHRHFQGRGARLRARGSWIPMGDAEVQEVGEVT